MEKPSLAIVEEYVGGGQYFWNSGMFVFKAAALLEEVEHFHPQMLSPCLQALTHGTRGLEFFRLAEKALCSLRK